MAMHTDVMVAPKTAEPNLALELQQINKRLDVLSHQVEHLYRRTMAAEELKDELVPVLRDVMDALREKLGEMESEFNSEEISHLLRKLVRSTPRFIRLLDHLEGFESLLDELRPLGRDMVRSTVETLQRADERGWFRMSQGAMDLFDRVAAETSQQDIDRLADNLMLIVNTVKRMTQPEMLALANNALGAFDVGREAPPKLTLWGLFKAMRDPQVQQGMGLVLEMTRQVARRPDGADVNGTEQQEQQT